ncbi:MAG: hypothetical protein ABIT92_00260 [Gammaproteobacteria bacterium]
MAIGPETQRSKPRESQHKDNHADPDKFPTMHSRNLVLGGAIVILGLILGGLILAYNVLYTETHRADAVPPSSAVPLRP